MCSIDQGLCKRLATAEVGHRLRRTAQLVALFSIQLSMERMQQLNLIPSTQTNPSVVLGMQFEFEMEIKAPIDLFRSKRYPFSRKLQNTFQNSPVGDVIVLFDTLPQNKIVTGK
jgi:hypothetical protein